jgi:hypothetical protein
MNDDAANTNNMGLNTGMSTINIPTEDALKDETSNEETSNEETSKEEISTEEMSVKEEPIINNIKTREEINLPSPIANARVDWECGTYFSDISLENMKNYLQMLVDTGWRDFEGSNISTELVEGTSNYMLSNGSDILQMMIFFRDKECSLSNSILVKMDTKLSTSEIKNRKDAISKVEALDKIQHNIDETQNQGNIPYTKRLITGLFEIFIDDAYDKLQLQAYAAISDNGFAGCFLIRRGIVSYVVGNLSNACIVDIDNDDKYELVDLYTTWDAGVNKIYLVAYEYKTPIYFSSTTEILQNKYYNCFVSEGNYEFLHLQKMDDTTINLVGEVTVYGAIKAQGTNLILDKTGKVPFVEWSVAYDQSQLLDLDKEIPATPPNIIISIDGLSVDYVVSPTKWGKKAKEFNTKEALAQISKSNPFIPTFVLAGWNNEEGNKSILIDFGKSIPDSIKVYDAMLDDQGNVRYGDKLIMEQTVKILDSSRVSFDLKQHMAFSLSSFLGDYEKDWRRLFRVVCKWGDKECVFAFLINTGLEETLTEISDHQFLNCEGSFSRVSSSWGLGFTIDSTNLPKHYIIEWQVSEGSLRKWSDIRIKPIGIKEQHNGYPMTFSEDNNEGAVIWTPLSFDTEKAVIVKAYIYKKEADKRPVAYSEIMIENRSGVFQKK